jgi:homospermidine synthase
MRTSGAETLSAAANVFMGQTEAPLVVKPYIPRMTRSELLCLMTGGMATIAGGVAAVYATFGAQLSIAEARRHVPYTNATCLQVAAGALGATLWAVRHPQEGLREADEIDFREVLEIARPYLGTLVGAYTEWTPLQGRGELFNERLVAEQPWLLQNVRARQWRA